jgi:hypothetical protein
MCLMLVRQVLSTIVCLRVLCERERYENMLAFDVFDDACVDSPPPHISLCSRLDW